MNLKEEKIKKINKYGKGVHNEDYFRVYVNI